jgi:hypothetical protein
VTVVVSGAVVAVIVSGAVVVSGTVKPSILISVIVCGVEGPVKR